MSADGPAIPTWTAVIDRRYSSKRKYPGFGNHLLDLFDEVRVTGEKQDLVCPAQLAERLECRAAAVEIEVDENIIKDHRQRIDVICVFADEREPHREIELFCSAAA